MILSKRSEDMFKELTEAIAAFNPARVSALPISFTNGDIAKWKKFANSLLLRLAFEDRKVIPLIRKYIEQAIAGGL